jgi:hypothetical protein
MKSSKILAFLVTTAWTVVLLMGFGSINAVRSQHAPGFPSAGQVHYYVYVPAAMLALVVALWSVAARYPPIRIPAVFSISLALLALPGYLFFYTGGM